MKSQSKSKLVAKEFTQWKQEFLQLRTILKEFPLKEEHKWMHPCYTLEGKNVVLVHGFKDYCALLFFKGALMQDPHNLLIQQTENAQSARQLRFKSIQDINQKTDIIKSYIEQAVDLEKSGAKVQLKPVKQYPVPEEFQARLDQMPQLQAAFHKLTPGRQRGYLLYFSSPKKSETRTRRVDDKIPQILDGLGLND